MPFKPKTDFPYKDTRAAVMLRDALDRAHRDQGLSIRSLGKRLGYKQATVLSHMALGRVPIPLERALDIAREIDLEPGEFLAACVEQKVDGAADLLRSHSKFDTADAFSFVSELRVIAGHALDSLSDGQKSVLREVAADPRPERRWLSLAELPVVEGLRRLRPKLATEGLSASDREAVEMVLK